MLPLFFLVDTFFSFHGRLAVVVREFFHESWLRRRWLTIEAFGVIYKGIFFFERIMRPCCLFRRSTMCAVHRVMSLNSQQREFQPCHPRKRRKTAKIFVSYLRFPTSTVVSSIYARQFSCTLIGPSRDVCRTSHQSDAGPFGAKFLGKRRTNCDRHGNFGFHIQSFLTWVTNQTSSSNEIVLCV